MNKPRTLEDLVEELLEAVYNHDGHEEARIKKRLFMYIDKDIELVEDMDE